MGGKLTSVYCPPDFATTIAPDGGDVRDAACARAVNMERQRMLTFIFLQLIWIGKLLILDSYVYLDRWVEVSFYTDMTRPPSATISRELNAHPLID